VQYEHNHNAVSRAVPIDDLVTATQQCCPDGHGISKRQIYYYLQPGDPSAERLASESMQLRTAILIGAALRDLLGVHLTLEDFDIHGVLEAAKFKRLARGKGVPHGNPHP
jgi:hypothetical protein